MKIIIAGAGEVGTHLAKMLSNENHDIVVIDTDQGKLDFIQSSYDLMTVTGSVTSIKILKEANIKKCDLYIAVATSEETNITSAILAKKLGAQKTIARVDSAEYLSPEYKELFTTLGIDFMIYPEKIASREIIALLDRTASSDFTKFSGGGLSLYVIKLDENAPVIGKSLIDMAKKNLQLEYRAVAITRNGETFIPKGCEHFLANDLVYIITNHAGIQKIIQYSGKENFEVNNLMILGGGRIGIRTAIDMESSCNIKLIEIDKTKCEQINEWVEKTLVINGDGRDIELLHEAGIENMDAFVAVTGNSEINILSCLVAKKLGVKKIICRVENFNYIGIAENMGINTIINEKVSAAGFIFRFTMSKEVSNIKCLVGTDAEIFEFVAKPNSLVTKDQIKNIDFPSDAIIGGVIRENNSFIAKGNTQIKANDIVVVFSLSSAIFKIGKYFK